jgi:predicted dehydrogenase
MSPPYNVGVIGYGLSAKVFHIPLIQAIPQSFNLYAIVQRRNTGEAESDHPNAKIFRSSEELFKDPKVDLIVVTTVPDSHYELCKLALEAGKNVVVEKPFTPTVKEANDLIALAKSKKLLLTVYQSS